MPGEATSDDGGHSCSSAILGPILPSIMAVVPVVLVPYVPSSDRVERFVFVGQIPRDRNCGGLDWCFSRELCWLWLVQAGGLLTSDGKEV